MRKNILQIDSECCMLDCAGWRIPIFSFIWNINPVPMIQETFFFINFTHRKNAETKQYIYNEKV